MNALYDIIGVPFGYLMRIINSLFPNYAVSILIFTIVTKLLLSPVTYSMQKSSARMRLLNPKLEKLKKSYSNNFEKLQEEQQKLYQEEGLNPMSSCMPSLIQMLLLFGVIDVVYKPLTHILGITKDVRKAAAEIAGTSLSNLRCELLTMENLSANADKYKQLDGDFFNKVNEFSRNFTLFGANLGKSPSLKPDVWDKEAVILLLLPFLAGLAQMVQSVYSQMRQKKNSPDMKGGGCMTFMMYFSPILTVVFGFGLPAGISFYWIWSALFVFAMNFVLDIYFDKNIVAINEREKAKAKAYAEKHPEKKTIMQRMLEQQALENEQNGTNSKKANLDKLSRSEMNKINRDAIKEARKRMAEKYGDDYSDDDNDNDNDED